MPYIKQEDREQYEDAIGQLVDLLADLPEDARKGHINFVKFSLMLGIANKIGLRYSILQDILGASMLSNEEFYRRVVAPYEDLAIMKNGDIIGIPHDEE